MYYLNVFCCFMDKDLTIKEATMFLLSLYQTVTMDYCIHTKTMDDDVSVMNTAFMDVI